MFGTELFKTGELTLSVIILFLELFTFRCEIRDESSSGIVSSAEGKRTERFSEKSSRYRESLKSEVRLPRD